MVGVWLAVVVIGRGKWVWLATTVMVSCACQVGVAFMQEPRSVEIAFPSPGYSWSCLFEVAQLADWPSVLRA